MDFSSQLFREIKDLRTKQRLLSSAFIFFVIFSGVFFVVSIYVAHHNHSDSLDRIGLLREEISYLHARDVYLERNLMHVSGNQENSSAISVDVAPFEDRPTPFDHVTRQQVEFDGDRFIIYGSDFRWSYFTDTKSMVPTLGASADGIEIVPKDVNDIHVGDIISYTAGNSTIIHRVVRLGYDEIGWYAITKADNLPKDDPYKIRFRQVQGILVGVIY